MHKILMVLCFAILTLTTYPQSSEVEWFQTSEKEQWKSQKGLTIMDTAGPADVEVELSMPLQTIEGFGTCFNELGWTSLGFLNATQRETILRDLFAPGVGASFSICRMPVAANDFSRRWYSYNETDGDFEMKNFSIANDLETLIPFISNAQRHNPSLRIWASPWSPPSWMKYNSHYAAKSVLGNSKYKSKEWGMDMTGINNGLAPEKEGKEGTNMFIQEEPYYKAYALYFARFIEAYRQQKINIEMVMPQNEFNSPQFFPSCTWTAAGLARFMAHLGPQMKALGVKVFFGTMERGNERLVDTILKDPQISPFVEGVGFQWAGKCAIEDIHHRYPNLTLYQSEQECGNGKNDWKYCVYTWCLMKHYLTSGANAYMYWNASLKEGGISTWGWKQNSLVSVDTVTKTYKYNYEYYLMKHLSHFVKPGAKRLTTIGVFEDLLAFVNPDKSIVIVAFNDNNRQKTLQIKVGGKMIRPSMKANSFNTWVFKN